MLYTKLLYFLEVATEEKKWYVKLFEDIAKQIKDFGREIGEFFGIIKKNTFDKLVEAFGETGVLIAFFTLLIIVGMIVATTIIRGKD